MLCLCMTSILAHFYLFSMIFFRPIHKVHQYNTRLSSKKSFYIPKIRTNYEKFSIRFNGAKIWNSIQDDFKLKGCNVFKRRLKESILNEYQFDT